MSVKFSNNGHSTLASSLSSSATSITVASGHGARFPSLTGSEYFYATLIDSSNNLEIVKVTARSTDVLTATRAQESTTARAYAIGDRIELRVTAQGLVDVGTPAADSITNAMMADDAIDTPQIADDAITSALIDDNAVGAAALNVSGNGTSGQVLLSDGDGTMTWGSGFSGNYALHAHDRYINNNTVTVTSVSSGNAEGQKDCIVINGGSYNSGSNGCTFTPAHADDLFFISGAINYFSTGNNGYAGLGVQISTSTDFSANRHFPYYNGQHSQGNGSGSGDEYRRLELSFVMTCAQLGMTAGTQYYFRLVGQKHDTSNTARYNEATGTTTNGRHQMTMVHWKKV